MAQYSASIIVNMQKAHDLAQTRAWMAIMEEIILKAHTEKEFILEARNLPLLLRHVLHQCQRDPSKGAPKCDSTQIHSSIRIEKIIPRWTRNQLHKTILCLLTSRNRLDPNSLHPNLRRRRRKRRPWYQVNNFLIFKAKLIKFFPSFKHLNNHHNPQLNHPRMHSHPCFNLLKNEFFTLRLMKSLLPNKYFWKLNRGLRLLMYIEKKIMSNFWRRNNSFLPRLKLSRNKSKKWRKNNNNKPLIRLRQLTMPMNQGMRNFKKQSKVFGARSQPRKH